MNKVHEHTQFVCYSEGHRKSVKRLESLSDVIVISNSSDQFGSSDTLCRGAIVDLGSMISKALQ